MLDSGSIDHCLLSAGEAAHAGAWKERLGFDLYAAGPEMKTLFIAYNQNPEAAGAEGGLEAHKLAWLASRNFRLALAHLVDRRAIVEEAAGGYGYPQVTFVPPGSPYYWAGAEAAAPSYDPEEAMRLLEKAGFRDRNGDGRREDRQGNELSLTLCTNEENGVRRAICERFASEARKAGIDIICAFEPFQVLVTRLVSSYDWELVLIGFPTDLDPIKQGDVFLSSGSRHLIEPGQLYPGREWESRLDAVWRVAVSTYDEETKKAALEKAQRIWIEEAPWVYTYAPAVIHAYKRTWGNMFPRSAEGYGLCAVLPRVYERNVE